MSNQPAISVRGVGKKYDLYRRNLDRIKHALTGKSHAAPFWALRDVNFEVNRGEAVGVVGRNGSGKSTLMQIIAGTLTPSEGEVHIRGRISALLELGSGFNPTFTGRENIYMAGAIQGFSRRQMDDKFDAIAGFADIGEFLEQPVEVYSSGMHSRLAFAVAISIEPDILIVDEILAVGDAGFQQRCIGRLHQMIDRGATLLFVSHNAETVKSICDRGLFLQSGKQEYFGNSTEAVNRYAASLRAESTERALQTARRKRPQLAAEPRASEVPPAAPADSAAPAQRQGTGHARITSVRLLDSNAQPVQIVPARERLTLEVDVSSSTDLDRCDVLMHVRDATGVNLFGSALFDSRRRGHKLLAAQPCTFRFAFENLLAPGPHGICLTLHRRPDEPGAGIVVLDHLDAAVAFESLSPAPPPPPAPTGTIRGKFFVPVDVDVLPSRAPSTVTTTLTSEPVRP